MVLTSPYDPALGTKVQKKNPTLIAASGRNLNHVAMLRCIIIIIIII
jgi:hypothetical protein